MESPEPLLSQRYRREADELEQSAVPVLLKIGRAVVWFLYAVIVVKVLLLVTAFVLRLLGASTDAAFTEWVYRSADRSMAPFRGIFPTTEVGEVSVLDLSLLFGAIVYVIAALGLDIFLRWITGKVAGQDRRVRELRQAAYEAELREYEAARQQAWQRAAADSAARAAATAVAAHQPPPPPPG